ncbi:N-formylglutamate amidohydrolase [Enterovirga rhinocerotis]|uniref:Putative N-formylglutamate amidohydrolase n=1 Tax=Enterovirga rhinocerotis TaxID=1339210 RepID=A0A4R7C7N9_9HYPH|nr:N-formylglutamate amidohydrolase [Enterovirga rhinocerotis]TDR94664.1 putative N-formylglutamate amidohydrolase [Enterovirga rhinocerotis]
MADTLLSPDEPSPVTVRHPEGRSPLFLTCDHAGRATPRRLGRLGLPESEFERHIAWDIGIAAVSRRISDALDATLVEQTYSRLVIDCNRPPSVPNSIPLVSEATPIPGNAGLTEAARQARLREVFEPYHARIEGLLQERAARPTVLVAMHSFTPVYLGEARPWQIGTLYGRDGRLGRALGTLLVREERFTVGDNQPYSVSDETDHTLPVHGERRGLHHVGIEIRQDLITDEAGQNEWADLLIRLLPEAASRVLD